MSVKVRLASAALVLAGVAAAAGVAAPSASADTILTATYGVQGTSHIASTNSDLALGPGELAASVDLSTGQISSGSLTLPDSTGTFDELGFVPVTATVAFEQVGQVTGSVNVVTGATTATAEVTLKITDLKVAGVDVGVGSSCQTVQPSAITVSSGTGFGILTGGPVSGTFTIGQFQNCGLLGIETPVINAVIPGPGNSIDLTLGAASLS